MNESKIEMVLNAWIGLFLVGLSGVAFCSLAFLG